jgi:hypothetical protein
VVRCVAADVARSDRCPRFLKRPRSLWLTAALITLASASWAGLALAAQQVVPLPSVHVLASPIRFGNRPALLVHSITVGNIGGDGLRVSCDRCRRYATKIRETRPLPTVKSYSGVNWIIIDDRDIQVEVTRAGQTGRFMLLGASAKRHLVFKASGCLSATRKDVPCPRGTFQPAPGSSVALGSRAPASSSPSTVITVGPPGYVSSTTATFDYTSNEAGSAFECRLDATEWNPCPTSTITYSGLADGAHSFSVRAVSSSGRIDPTPPQWSWLQESTPPTSTITTEPSIETTSTAAVFDFSASETSTFQCQLDGGVWVACNDGTQTYESLSGGTHVFAVSATNQAGVVESAPAQFSWTIHVPVVDYSCPAGTGQNGHYVPSGYYWGNPFTAPGGTITGGYLLIGANEDGGDHNALIGLYSEGETGRPLAEAVVGVHGYGGVHFTFAQPVSVSPNQQLWITVFGDGGDFTAYDTNEGDQCFVGDLEGFS